MPKTFYAVTTPILSGSVEKKKLPHFANDYRDVRTLKQFNYNQLIAIINSDLSIKLFVSEAAAKAHGAEKEIIEEKSPEPGSGLAHLGLAILSPHLFALKIASDVLLGPNQVRNLYQSIIFKVTIKNENSILPDNSNPSIPDCVGLLPDRVFRTVSDPDHSQKRSLSFSTASNYYLHSVKFRKDHNYRLSFTARYPSKYSEVHDDGNVNVAATLLKDYFAPKHGLFLTGHWRRHHLEAAKALFNQIQGLDRAAALNMLWDKRIELQKNNSNLDGSFFRRISYAIEMLTPSEPVIEQHRNLVRS